MFRCAYVDRRDTAIPYSVWRCTDWATCWTPGVRNFFLIQNVLTGCWAHLISVLKGTMVFFSPGVKRPEYKSDHSPTSSVAGKYERGCTFAAPFVHSWHGQARVYLPFFGSISFLHRFAFVFQSSSCTIHTLKHNHFNI